MQYIVEATFCTNWAPSVPTSINSFTIANFLLGEIRKFIANKSGFGLIFESEILWKWFSLYCHHWSTCWPLYIGSWLPHINCSHSLQDQCLFPCIKTRGVLSMFRIKSWCLCDPMSFCFVGLIKFNTYTINFFGCCCDSFVPMQHIKLYCMIQWCTTNYLTCSCFSWKLQVKLHVFLMIMYLVMAISCLWYSNMNWNSLFVVGLRRGESLYFLNIFALDLFDA